MRRTFEGDVRQLTRLHDFAIDTQTSARGTVAAYCDDWLGGLEGQRVVLTVEDAASAAARRAAIAELVRMASVAALAIRGSIIGADLDAAIARVREVEG